MELTQTEHQIKNNFKKLKIVYKTYGDNIKCTNILYYMGPRKRREMGARILFEEIIAKNFPNLRKETDIQVWKAKNFKKDEPKEIHSKTHYN